MGLQQFTIFNTPANSFELRQAMMGILKPGRYAGFNVATVTTGLNFDITHQNGYIKAHSNNITSFNNFGVFVMPTGQIYHDDTAVLNVTLDAETDGNIRYDAVIAKAQYSNSGSMVTPTYHIVKNINQLNYNRYYRVDVLQIDEVPLGVFKIPANATTSTGVVYEPYMNTLINGFGDVSDSIDRIIVPQVQKQLLYNYHNRVISIDNNSPLIDQGGNLYQFKVLPEHNNATFRVSSDYSGSATKIRLEIDNDIDQTNNTYTTLYREGFKISAIWDALPISVVINNRAAVTTNLVFEASKKAETRAQYTRMDVQRVVSDSGSLYRFIATGDLASA